MDDLHASPSVFASSLSTESARAQKEQHRVHASRILSRFAHPFLGSVCFGIALGLSLIAIRDEPRSFHAKQSIVDLGDVYQGQTLDAYFDLMNERSEAVTITGVTHSCACSEAKVSATQIEPGHAARLSAKWKTENRRGKSGVSIFIGYSGHTGPNGTLEVTIAGKVVPDIDFEPREIDFQEGVSSTKKIQFLPGKLREFVVERSQCSHPAFEATVDQQAKSIALAFDHTKWIRGDTFCPELVVWTSNERERRMYIEITVR